MPLSWSLWAAAIGAAFEFMGFVLLGYEIIRANAASLAEAKALAAEKSLFTSLMVDDGQIGKPDSGSAKIEGGILGRLIGSIPHREAEFSRSRRVVWIGLVLSGLGVVMQIVGAVAQALTTS